MHTQVSTVIFHRNDGSAILEWSEVVDSFSHGHEQFHSTFAWLKIKKCQHVKNYLQFIQVLPKASRAMSVRRDSSSILLVGVPANIFDMNSKGVGFKGSRRHAAWTSLWRFMCVYIHVHTNRCRCLYRCIFDYICIFICILINSTDLEWSGRHDPCVIRGRELWRLLRVKPGPRSEDSEQKNANKLCHMAASRPLGAEAPWRAGSANWSLPGWVGSESIWQFGCFIWVIQRHFQQNRSSCKRTCNSRIMITSLRHQSVSGISWYDPAPADPLILPWGRVMESMGRSLHKWRLSVS